MLVNGQDPTMWPTIWIVGIYAAIGAVAFLFCAAMWAVESFRRVRQAAHFAEWETELKCEGSDVP